MRKQYPSDISREQFNEIRPYLDNLRKKTRPREIDLYDVFCAILYVLDSGCPWRMIPGDFPKWQTVYFYWTQWRKPDADGASPLAKALKKSGRRTPAEPRPPSPYALHHRRFPKRAEYTRRTGQRL
jgi:transposase